MVTKQDDPKNIIRELLSEDLGQIKSRTICREELEIQITRTDDGSVRFDLPDQNKSYVLMSGRLYERQYKQKNDEVEKAEEEPETLDSIPASQSQKLLVCAEQLNYRQ